MSKRIYLRLAVPALTAAFILSLPAHGQSQDAQQSESVADAARRAQEQKKAAAKPSHVVDNDTIKPASPATPGDNSSATPSAPSPDAAPKPSSETTPQPPTDSANSSAPDKSTATPAPQDATPEEEEKKKKDAEELTGLKQQLAEAQKGLDLLQRDLALQQDSYYSNPDHDKDTAGKAKLDDLKQQVLDKQQQVADLKAKVAALVESLGNTVPAPATEPPPTPPS